MNVPLFPLGTVLFPAGRLPLRIFEARYIDMVRDCMRNDSGFGVVAIREGGEVGPVGSFFPSGTLAAIDEWDQGADGLLHLRCTGRERFRVVSHEIKDDGLVVAEIDLQPDAAPALPDELRPLSTLLESVFSEHAAARAPEPWHMDDAAWVGYRLAELAPLPAEVKVRMLEMDTGAEVLHLLAGLLSSDGNTPPPSA